MKKLFLTMFGVLLLAPFAANAKVNVFACEPEWAALANEVGSDLLNVTSATHAKQDPHHIRARPSLIASIRKADIVLCSGGGLEEGWLPILLQKAPKQVQHGQVGHLMAAEHVELLGVPEILDRSDGHIHASGNPHVHLNPHNISIIAKLLTERLQQIDADNQAIYVQTYNTFRERWNAAISRWEAQATALKNLPIIVHHAGWHYLENWLGLTRVASLEPKPGIPPSVSHLEVILEKVKAYPIKAIIRTPYEPEKASKWLSVKTNVPHMVLPYTVGGMKDTESLEAMFDKTLVLLSEVK